MDFFNSAVTTLQTIVVGLGGALCVWAPPVRMSARTVDGDSFFASVFWL